MDEEYTVENVMQARVVNKKNSKKKIWNYRVKWLGYPSSGNTWEPIESFEGSEAIIDEFWSRADTGGRDIDNMDLFTNDEVFFPVGSGPVEQPRRKSAPRRQSSPGPAKQAKRKRSPSVVVIEDDDSEDQPAKRPKPRQGRSSTRSVAQKAPAVKAPVVSASAGPSRRKKPQPEPSPPPKAAPLPKSSPVRPRKHSQVIIPDSEEERDPSEEPAPTRKARGANKASASTAPVASSSSRLFSDDEVNVFDSSRDPTPPPNPRPRANPVKPNGSATRPNEGAPGPRKARPGIGPGRPSMGLKIDYQKPPAYKPSLLTFSKAEGGLKSQKGVYAPAKDNPEALSGSSRMKQAPKARSGPSGVDDMDMDAGINALNTEPDHPIIPPTAKELLTLAGLDEKANELEDYEDDTPAPESAQHPAASSSATHNSLFPAAKVQTARADAGLWKRSTLFGTLGMTSEPTPAPPVDTSSPRLSLYFEHPKVISVHVTDILPKSAISPFTEVVIQNGIKPSGLVYDKGTSHRLIDTLRTGGPAGRLVLVDDATDEQKEMFENLCEQLKNDCLCLHPFQRDLLAIFSSQSALVCQRLNIPQTLFATDHNHLLVSRVSIQNSIDYANLVS